MEKTKSLISFRERLMKASSKEEAKLITRELLQNFKNRYLGLRQFVNEDNSDIKERLLFLKNNVCGNILDIGTYDGYFIHELEKEGFKVTGTDMMEETIPLFEKDAKLFYPESSAQIIITFAEALPFNSNAFDTVIISHVLEHVFDPSLSLQEALRVCTSGGNIIIIVPPDLGNDPTHVRVVTELWLKQELKNFGTFKLIKTVGKGTAYIFTKK